MKAVFAATDEDGNTPLAIAYKVHDVFFKKVLHVMFNETDAETSNAMRKALLINDGDGSTPVHAAVMRGREKSLQKLLEVLSAVDDGLCKKVLAIKVGVKQCTPLHLASEYDYPASVQMLLDHGAVRGMKDKLGTALMIAKRCQCPQVVRVLQKANSKEASTPRQSPLQRRELELGT
ncbi:hypothetical protein HDU96_007718 [Phlyctochytrium bullatum]|nr:hypothetical protein HDU96_007718 [Phlyctochytrium bullatum]